MSWTVLLVVALSWVVASFALAPLAGRLIAHRERPVRVVPTRAGVGPARVTHLRPGVASFEGRAAS